MELIKITPENLENEHICCAISSNKDPQVMAKKAWMQPMLAEGFTFLKGDVRGKCFIEYLPAEQAWVPIEAEGYMHINCFWVSGQLKGQGNANRLLEACIRDSKDRGKLGLCVISSEKKRPFLSDPKYLSYKGFLSADTADPYFTLLYLPFREDAPIPKFREQARQPHIDQKEFVLYYTCGCPFTAKYVPLVEQTAHEAGLAFTSVRIEDKDAAQRAPVVWTNYALFYNGAFVTNEIQSKKKFLSLAQSLA